MVYLKRHTLINFKRITHARRPKNLTELKNVCKEEQGKIPQTRNVQQGMLLSFSFISPNLHKNKKNTQISLEILKRKFNLQQYALLRPIHPLLTYINFSKIYIFNVQGYGPKPKGPVTFLKESNWSVDPPYLHMTGSRLVKINVILGYVE